MFGSLSVHKEDRCGGAPLPHIALPKKGVLVTFEIVSFREKKKKESIFL
jgi:hypothetical protein